MHRRKYLIQGITLIFTLFFFNTLLIAHELSSIQSNIHALNASWEAGETSISKLAPETRKMRLGLILPTSIQKDEAFSSQGQAYGLPVGFDWRDNGGNYVTPIRDQGNCGSCWAFATAGALESITLIGNNTPGVDLNVAEQVLLSCSGAGSCSGGYIDSASNFIRDTGLPLETCYPYIANNGNCANACFDWQSSTNQINSWDWIATVSPTVNDLKNALYTYGPLVTTMDVYTDFYYYRNGVYSYTWGGYEGGHAVLIVGYDDVGQYFIVKNSWGTGWGESGYFRIRYSEMSSAVFFGYWTIAYTAFPFTGTITVSAPDGGETWVAGSTETIRWTYTENPGHSVRIELLKGGILNRVITSQTAIGSSGSGSYNWSVPSNQADGSDYQVRVTSAEDSSYTDTSDGNFTIEGPPPPEITVTRPVGGETWAAGTTEAITWTSAGAVGSYVTIALLKGGSVVSTLNSYAQTSSGAYNWRIPTGQSSGNDYQIRVSDRNNSSVNGTSGLFTIEGAPPPGITVTSPNGGEDWEAGVMQTIQWNYSGNPGYSVRIELLKGGVLNRTIYNYARIGSSGSGSYNWMVPYNQAAGSDYQIRITSTSNGSYTDLSDNTFTIQ